MRLRSSPWMLAGALALAGSAQATVINFDNPGFIDIDNNTGVLTYTEAGYSISDDGSFGFLLQFDNPPNQVLAGFANAQLSLQAVNGGLFALTSLDYAFFDLGFGDPAGDLTVTGLLNGLQVASAVLPLGALTTYGFAAGFAAVNQVTFVGTSGYQLDNINVAAVPEPASWALVAIGLIGLLALRRRSAPPYKLRSA